MMLRGKLLWCHPMSQQIGSSGHILVCCGGVGHVEDVYAGNYGVDGGHAGRNLAWTNRLFW